MPTRTKQYSPEVLAEAQRMANSTATAMVYEYELVDAPVGDNLLGITYVGQSCEPCMAPDAALIDRDQKHVREAKSHPNKPFSRAINSYGKTAIKGPHVIAKTKGKRLAAMEWANEKECQLIVARGGKWRDGSCGAAQTLNEKPGGQGDPWIRLCSIAHRKLKAGPRVRPQCEHPGFLQETCASWRPALLQCSWRRRTLLSTWLPEGGIWSLQARDAVLQTAWRWQALPA